MPITVKRDELVERYMQCDALVREYYATTRAQMEVPDIDFDWPRYIALDHQKLLLLVSALDGQELAGFAMYVIDKHPHHKTVKMAACDTLAVRLRSRGMGIAQSIMRVAEQHIRDMQVSSILHTYRHVYDHDDVTPLFPRLGFDKFETTYIKHLPSVD